MYQDIQSFVVESRHDSFELLESEALVGRSLLVDMGAVHHLQNFFVIEVFVQLLANSLQLIETDHSSSFRVEKSEDSLEAILGLSLTNSRANDVEELFELDGAADVLQSMDERQDERVTFIESEFFQNFVDFFWVNGSTSVFVENIECVFEFFVIFGGESVFPGGGGRGCGFGCGLVLGCSAHLLKLIVFKQQSIRYDLRLLQNKT